MRLGYINSKIHVVYRAVFVNHLKRANTQISCNIEKSAKNPATIFLCNSLFMLFYTTVTNKNESNLSSSDAYYTLEP